MVCQSTVLNVSSFHQPIFGISTVCPSFTYYVDIHLVSSCHTKTHSPISVHRRWKHLCAWHTSASVRLKRRFIVPPLLLPLFHFVLVTLESFVSPVSPSLLCLGGLFPTLHRSQLTHRRAVFHQTADICDVQDKEYLLPANLLKCQIFTQLDNVSFGGQKNYTKVYYEHVYRKRKSYGLKKSSDFQRIHTLQKTIITSKQFTFVNNFWVAEKQLRVQNTLRCILTVSWGKTK